jgi:NAD(P)-dependent dehydrogenase (short-subunit alcohol dehydrogenase family)
LRETAPLAAERAVIGGTWLITGGLGAIGRRLAARLVARGASRVVLASRGAARAEVPLELRGLPVETANLDAIDARACADLVARLVDLRGVVHAAGVLDDCITAELTPARLDAVLAPKVAGAWNLHRAVEGRAELQHFVLLSSSAALLGSPGQANYAAANLALEELAHMRARAGLPALAIHFGPWAEAGMAAGAATARRLEALGLRSLSSPRALDALETLLKVKSPALGYFTVDWRRFARAVPPGVEPRRLEPFLGALSAQAQEGEPDLLSRLIDAESEERCALLADYAARSLARVLRMPVATLDRQRPLTELGLDSLMGVELSNRIQGDLFCAPPMSAILGASSIAAFGAALLAAVEGTGLLLDPGGDDADLLDEIESLSEEEVQRLLGE